MTSEQDHPRRISSRYLLSGLLRCPQCGAPINGNSSTYRGGIRAIDTYVCTGVRKHLCNSRRIPRELLEETVIDTIKSYILKPELILARQELDAETHVANQAQALAERAAHQAKLVKTRKRLANISEALSERGKSVTLLAQLDQLESDQAALLTKLSATDQAAAPFVHRSLDELIRYSRKAIDLLQNGTLDEKRLVLRGTLHCIQVENVDKRLKGIIYFYSPTLRSKPNHDPPDAVTMLLPPPGAPRYRHSITIDVPYDRKPRSR